MSQFRNGVSILLLWLGLSLTFPPVSMADSIELTKTLFERTEGSTLDESQMLTVHFIDVGGGDAILIDTPSDKKILIDGGWTWGDRGLASPEYKYYLERFLADDVVDLAVITHPDYDHFAGLSDVLSTYVVRQVWYNGYDSEELSTSWRNLITKIKETEGLLFLSPLEEFMGLGSKIRIDDSETYLATDDVVLTLVNAQREIPPQAYGSGRSMNEAQRRNSSSMVLRLDYGGTSFLLTGDTNGRKKQSTNVNECDDQELFMVQNHENSENPLHNSLDCDVLKVGHHGSDGSSSLRFLKAASPEWAVVCAGVPHGHPHSPVITRLKGQYVALDNNHILRTDDGEDNQSSASQSNLGDDCYQFFIDPSGIVRIEKWNIKVD